MSAAPTQTMIEVNDLWKAFGPLQVLKGISLEVPKGSAMALIGPSGSGKSTLLRCINLLERIDEGRIVVDGMVVGDRGTSITRLRSEVGMSPPSAPAPAWCSSCSTCSRT